MNDATLIYCMSCRCLKEKSNMIRVFQTGFRRIEGIDYHLGICMRHFRISAEVEAGLVTTAFAQE